MYHEDSSTLWQHRFWKCNHSMKTACTVHILNRNHYTWGGRDILISPAAQLMESQTHIHLSSPSLKNEEDNFQIKENFLPVTLSHHLQYLYIVNVQGKPAGRNATQKRR